MSSFAPRNVFLEEVWFRLMHIPGIGRKALWEIANQCENQPLSGDIEQDKPILQRTTLTERTEKIQAAYTDTHLEQQWQALQAKGVGLLHPQHPLLQLLFDPSERKESFSKKVPAVLFYWGEVASILSAPTVGIVGARDALPYILEQTQQLASALAAQGISILSGYARGVDNYAHLGALNAEGHTAAILPYGITSVFEDNNPVLKNRLSAALTNSYWQKKMLFLSEFYPESRWKNQHYILRNHTICALSQRLIVMAATAPTKSGSYQTGTIAQEMGIPLYVFMPEKRKFQSTGNQALCEKYGATPLSETELLPALSPPTQTSNHSRT